MADASKTPAKTPASPIDWDVTEFVRNPSGVVHDVQKSHPGALLAAVNKEGWRLATLEEAQEYCERHNIDPAGLEKYGKHVKEAQAEAEKVEKLQQAAAAPPSIEPAEEASKESAPKTKK